MKQAYRLGSIGILAAALLAPVSAQQWNLPSRGAGWVDAGTEGKLKIGFEQRGRYEHRTGQGFGADPDLDTGLYRTRLSLTYKPVSWLKMSGTVQDARAPWYGPGAPSSVRDQGDLHEAYIELFPQRKKGFGLSAGRMMLKYGDSRLIGSPDWGNLSRTFDQVRAYWGVPGMQLEFLLISPVKIRSEEFNRPVMGERIWGAYNTFANLWRKNSVDVYLLRHDQNRPGGFNGGNRLLGTDRLGVNTYGARMTGPLGKLKYGLEAAVQTGKVGPASHRAGAAFSSLSRRWTLWHRNLDVSGEYKFASGTRNPADTTRVSTFDQLSPANHDKFGHQDLFGWRNLHNARSLTTWAMSKSLALNFLYDSWWLASKRDALYSGSGKAIARSASGTAGRHVGQETDVFVTYKIKAWTWGGGYGRLFKGEFVRKATRGVEPNYAYVFHTYSF